MVGAGVGPRYKVKSSQVGSENESRVDRRFLFFHSQRRGLVHCVSESSPDLEIFIEASRGAREDTIRGIFIERTHEK